MTANSAAAFDVPAHVPQHLVMDFDVDSDPMFQGDPQANLQKLQKRKPMFYTPRGGGMWVVTDGAAVSEVYCSPDKFSARFGPDGSPEMSVAIPMGIDPPEHRKYRMALEPIFATKVMNVLSDSVRALAVDLIEGVRPKRGCEFVSEIAEPFPVTIFLRLADFPVSELATFRQWAKELFHSHDPAIMEQAIGKISHYIAARADERRNNPGEDMLSSLLKAEVDGRPLNAQELTSMMFTIFGGGLDTVLNTMSFVMRFLAENPDHRRQLVADPALIPHALEELMRRHAMVSLYRQVKEDVNFHGVDIKKGDRLWCSTVMLSVDEALMPEPLKVDFSRTSIRNPIFGVGPHHCPGHHLARLELRIFLEEWLRRIPDFSMAPDADLKILTGPAMGLVSLPLTWPS